MSPRNVRGDLVEIAEAIDRARRHVAQLSRDEFLKSETVCDAVAMQILVIGEAVRRLPAEALVAMPEIPWARIIALRNRIAHGYAGMNWSVIWDIVSDELQPVAAAVARLLAEPGPADPTPPR